MRGLNHGSPYRQIQGPRQLAGVAIPKSTHHTKTESVSQTKGPRQSVGDNSQPQHVAPKHARPYSLLEGPQQHEVSVPQLAGPGIHITNTRGPAKA